LDLLSYCGGAVLQHAVSLRESPAATGELRLLHVVGRAIYRAHLTSTVVDYYLGILLEAATGRRKKFLLAVSLVVNLGILGFFKYYDFFAGSLADLLHIPRSSVVLQVVLPVGVRFYTFASLSYTFDVYWGKMKADFLSCTVSMAFCPWRLGPPRPVIAQQ
jgi:D-alanyl-lipoteichoic acid acyltransferase DltB (MBOAT superfamily)